MDRMLIINILIEQIEKRIKEFSENNNEEIIKEKLLSELKEEGIILIIPLQLFDDIIEKPKAKKDTKICNYHYDPVFKHLNEMFGDGDKGSKIIDCSKIKDEELFHCKTREIGEIINEYIETQGIEGKLVYKGYHNKLLITDINMRNQIESEYSIVLKFKLE